jgi:hypothetical protein
MAKVCRGVGKECRTAARTIEFKDERNCNGFPRLESKLKQALGDGGLML